ncbi:MAG TPA: hypothetical protein PLV92_09090, partial [Pirellulaceae bacterium]|nr:hypothetical protein [Pirellulaceae bacterium]
ITFAAGASITVNAGGGGLWFAGDPSTHGTLGLGGGVVLASSPGAGIYIDSNFNNLTLGQNISTQGGAVSLGLPVILTSNTSIVTNANGSTGADITFGGAVVSASGTQSLTLNAGTAGDITSTSSLGGTGGANNGELNGLTITSARDVSLATVRTVNGLSSSSSTFAASGPIDSRNAAVAIDASAASGAGVSLDDVDTHGQNLLITAAAHVVFSGGADSLASTGGGGRFQLAGLTAATTLGLGDGASGSLTVASNSLDAIGAGFTSGIEFGRTGQTGQIQFAGATQSYDENVKVWADGGAMIELLTSLDTVENGATGKSITLAGSAVSTIQLGKNLTTAGGDVVATGGTFYVVGIGTGGGAHRIDTGNAFAATNGGRIDLGGVTQIDGLSYSDGFNLRAPLLTLRTAGSQTAASLTLPNVIGNPSSGHGLNQLDLQTATPVTATTPNVADITLRNVRLVSLAGDAGARLLINSTSSLDGSVFVNGTFDLTGADNSAVSAAKSLFMPSSSTATLAVLMDGDFTARGIAGTPLGRYLDSVDINLDATPGGFVGTLRLDSGLPAGTLLAVDGAATGSPPSSTITIAGNVLLPATGPLTMTTNPTATRLASGSIDLRNAVLNGPGELTLNTSVGTSGGSGTPAAGFVYLGDAGTAALPLTQLTISTSNQAGGAAGAVRLGDSDPFSPTVIYISTGALDLTSATRVELLDDVDIHTQPTSSVGTAGDVLFDSSSSARLIGNLHSLTIETRGSGASRGDVVLPGTIGQNSGEELSQLVVDANDGQITFGAPATVGGVDVLRTTGLVRFTGAVQLSTDSQWSTQGGDIDLSGSTLDAATGASPSAPTLSLDTDANNTGAGGDVLASDIAGLGGLSIDTGSAVTGGLLRFGPDPVDDVTVTLAAPFSYSGRGVVLADSTRITTTTAAGNVSLLAPISAIVGGAELEITTSASGAEVSLGRIGPGVVSGDQGPSALKVTTTGSGKLNLDNDVFVSPPFAATTAVKLVGNVEVGADVRVATDAGAFGAGPIDLSAARLYASALGRSLILDSTNSAGSADVTLGVVDSGPTGGAYLTQLDVQTGGGSNFGGDLLLTRDLLLDSSATRTARLSFVGDDLVVASANVTIDTEQGGDLAGGDVLLSSSSIAATTTDSQLTIDALGNGTGGDIQFGAVDNAGGTRQFLGSFAARTQTGGTIALQGDIRTDATAAIAGGVT